MKEVRIYTDGACSGNQNDNNIGGWGAILEYGQYSKELHGGEVNTTNNRMELMALIEALSALKEKGLSIKIYADSSYLINCFKEKWYVKWQMNGWKTSSKAAVENKELWQKLIELMEDQEIQFYLVKGHVKESTLKSAYMKYIDHNGMISLEDFQYISAKNNRADELANVFIKENA
ncbi:MAG: ribonuclease HI [Bacillota bacterium]|nr:ribonuclease HI [Bacillota bacterium]